MFVFLSCLPLNLKPLKWRSSETLHLSSRRERFELTRGMTHRGFAKCRPRSMLKHLCLGLYDCVCIYVYMYRCVYMDSGLLFVSTISPRFDVDGKGRFFWS